MRPSTSPQQMLHAISLCGCSPQSHRLLAPLLLVYLSSRLGLGLMRSLSETQMRSRTSVLYAGLLASLSSTSLEGMYLWGFSPAHMAALGFTNGHHLRLCSIAIRLIAQHWFESPS